MGRQRESDEAQATSSPPVPVVGRRLATVMGGGMATLFGSTAIWFLSLLGSVVAVYLASPYHDAGHNYGLASAATSLTGGLLGLLALDILLVLLFFWRCRGKQREVTRGGLFSRATCSIALTGSIGMTVVFALQAIRTLWTWADSPASLISDQFVSSVIGLGAIASVFGFFGGGLGVLVGVLVGAAVGAITHIDESRLGQQEARLLTGADFVLSLLSVPVLILLIFILVALPFLGCIPALIAWGLTSIIVPLLFRGLGWWFAHNESNGEQ